MVLLKIEEQIPRIRFEQDFLDSTESLGFILKEMQSHNITPEFILNFYRLVEEVETAASDKFNIHVKINRIFIKSSGNGAGVDWIKANDLKKVRWYRIEPELFEWRNIVSVLVFDLDDLINYCRITEGERESGLKSLIAHEIGHDISGFKTAITVENMQQGLSLDYIDGIRFDFSPYTGELPIGFIFNRLREILADTVALQLTTVQSATARDRMEGLILGFSYDVKHPLEGGLYSYAMIYDAWRIAKARFLGLNNIADEIQAQAEILAASSSYSKYPEFLERLISDFGYCFENWRLNTP